MAITDVNLSGKIRADDGSGVSGATVTIHETSAALTGDQEGSAVTSDSAGTWSFTEQTLTETYDVKISSSGGGQVRHIPWSDEITLKTVDTSVLKVRGASNAAAAPIYLFADLATDAGDAWRIQATDSDTLAIGSDKASAGTIIDYITITNGATAAASNTTILGQLTIGVNDTGADVKFFGATSGRYWLWDESADGVVQIGTLTVGVDDTGHDVKFFGATSGQFLLWDESADELVLAGDTKLSFHDAAGGENIIASANGHLEINAGTTLDITAPTVDLNSSTEFNIDTAAYDLNASGAVTVDSDAGISLDGAAASNFTTSGGALTLTSAAAATWSTGAGVLTVNGTAGINLQEGGSTIISISDARALATTNTAAIDLDGSGTIQINSSGAAISVANDNVDQTVNLATAGTRTLNIGINDGTDVTTIANKGNVTQTGTITVGVDDTGYDVKFFGATASAYLLWDESEDDLVLAGAAGIDLAGNIDVDGTANLDAVDIDGAVQIDATFTSGVDGQGYDTKFFGDTSGAYILWDTSADKLLTAGGAVVDIVKDKLLIGGTAVTTTAAELNVLDNVTAGTAAASKAVVLDGSRNIATIGNLTIDGVFTDGNYTFDTSGNVSGLGTLAAGAPTFSGDLFVTKAGASLVTNATSGNCNFFFYENGTYKYAFRYDTGSNYWALSSTDIGSGQDSDIIRILDGQASVIFTDSADENAFQGYDYVCGSCGNHGLASFDCVCGGLVSWCDDVGTMELALQKRDGVISDSTGVEKLEKMGLFHTYDDGKRFINISRFPYFLMSGLIQLNTRLKALETVNGNAN